MTTTTKLWTHKHSYKILKQLFSKGKKRRSRTGMVVIQLGNNTQ